MSAPVQLTSPAPAWMATAVIERAAHLVEQSAHELQATHSVAGEWNGDAETRQRYEDEMQSARELRALLTRLVGAGAEPAVRVDRGEDGRGLYERAVDVTVQDGEASVGMLCRALSIDESAARRVLAEMQRLGVVDPAVDGWHKVRAS